MGLHRALIKGLLGCTSEVLTIVHVFLGILLQLRVMRKLAGPICQIPTDW